MSTLHAEINNNYRPKAVDIAHTETQRFGGLSNWFSSAAAKAAGAVGTPTSFLAAVALIIAWGITGPMYHYSDTWQLVLNTATNIITFLIVFLIQNTQSRDAKAIHLKLNELIHSAQPAHNELIDVEKLSDEELNHLGAYYEKVRAECDRRHPVQHKIA